MIEVASLRYGVIFRKVFSKPHIFTAFAKDFTGIDIEIDEVETEKSFSPVIGNVDSRFDLFAEDKKNRVIIDIQHKRLTAHYDRFLHYHCAALLEQAKSSKSYIPDRQVFTIVVLTSGDRHREDIAMTDFEPKTLDGRGIGETKHKIIYVCPKYVTDKTPEPYQEWLKAIDDTLDNQVDETIYHHDIIKEIFNLIKKDKTTPQEYARMKDQYSNEQYEQEKYEEGREKGIKESAKKMLANGLELSLVSKITELSIEELQKL